MLNRTSPRANFQTANSNINSQEFLNNVGAPAIQIDSSFNEEYTNVEPIEIKKELFLRLLKTNVISLQAD